MFRVKICGITQPSDAALACRAGADAVGLNFYAQSPRRVDLETARKIAQHVSPGVLKVGVFVNAPAETIAALANETPLDAIQLHGDEPPELLLELPPLPVLKAYRCGALGLGPLVAFLARCRELGRTPDALLIDAAAPGQYGGSGQTVDWKSLGDSKAELGELPVILAGGLKPENVAEAIRLARPAGVDVASGVECSPGVKDVGRVNLFARAARAAFASEPASG